ncbi:organic solute transporter Ostalpha-domain-containing protein [Xylogone sp. PMI_703]|nr:organic solute transporter Ostalpha-domain-containing protein [Xylogone sp. PMI_703]
MAAVFGGTGQKLTHATIIVAGVSSLLASILSTVSIWLQTVPIYSISSWSSIISLKAAMFVDPIRDIYEAFTIYTFFQLLINFIGGERALIIMMHGRKPVSHLWPLNHFLPQVDISDPHTFLAIKRGILQYTWLKPILALASIIMKSTNVYQEGYIGLSSGYFWSGIIYNISVTVSLYSLGLFWVCMSKDLKPFRPVPKFLSIKLIIFASYWQGFFLSILVWLGAIPDNVQGYTPDNLAAAIQDTLICIEMPLFAIAHWSAFSWHDYADASISAARMPVWYAIRDAFGIRDLIEDTKETFIGNKYRYRFFDSGENTLEHENSSSRVARMMEGMRYERGGRGKYWIPKPGEATARTPLLSGDGQYFQPPPKSHEEGSSDGTYGAGDLNMDGLDPEEERLYAKAREHEFGDWNYPVITTQEISRERWLHAYHQRLVASDNDTSSLGSSRIQPTDSYNGPHREIGQNKSQWTDSKGKTRSTTVTPREQRPLPKDIPNDHSSPADMSKPESSYMANRAQPSGTEGETKWPNSKEEEGDGVRDGKQLNQSPQSPIRDIAGDGSREGKNAGKVKTELDADEFTVGEESDESPPVDSDESREWKSMQEGAASARPKYGLEGEEFDNVWSSSEAP